MVVHHGGGSGDGSVFFDLERLRQAVGDGERRQSGRVGRQVLLGRRRHDHGAEVLQGQHQIGDPRGEPVVDAPGASGDGDVHEHRGRWVAGGQVLDAGGGQGGATYVASYYSNQGSYAADSKYFGSQYNSGSLHVPANGGVFAYGSRSSFPNQTFNGNNYWVDVAFSASGSPPAPGDTTAPTVTATSPASGATGVAVGASVTATFSEAVQSGTIGFTLKNSAGATIASTTSYNAANNTVTLKPTAALAYSTAYTVTLSGAKDAAGNTMASRSWSFTTAAAPDTTAPTVTATSPASARRASRPAPR